MRSIISRGVDGHLDLTYARYGAFFAAHGKASIVR